jgi:hypothetical protein
VRLFGGVHLGASVDAKAGYLQHNLTVDARDRQIGNSARRHAGNAMGAFDRLTRFGPFVTESGKPVSATAVLGPYLQDASFVRFRELSVSWDLPGRILNRLGARGATLTLAARNLGLWTGYEGDPEVVSYISESAQGGPEQYWQTDVLTMPQPQRWLARLVVRF